MRVGSGHVELPDGGDPVACQDRQGEVFGQPADAGHMLRPLQVGIAINLVSRGPQAVHAMPVHIAFPG